MDMKKTCLLSMALAVFLAIPAKAQFVVVQKTNIKKELSYEVMEEKDFKELQAITLKESALFSRAMAIAEKEWRADATTKTKPFPKSMLQPPRIISMGKFADQDRAAARAEPLQKKIEDEKERAEDMARKKAWRDSERRKEKEKERKKMGINKPIPVPLDPAETLEEAFELLTAKISELLDNPAAGMGDVKPAKEEQLVPIED